MEKSEAKATVREQSEKLRALKEEHEELYKLRSKVNIADAGLSNAEKRIEVVVNKANLQLESLKKQLDAATKDMDGARAQLIRRDQRETVVWKASERVVRWRG